VLRIHKDKPEKLGISLCNTYVLHRELRLLCMLNRSQVSQQVGSHLALKNPSSRHFPVTQFGVMGVLPNARTGT
jgi:hypothetical protein